MATATTVGNAIATSVAVVLIDYVFKSNESTIKIIF